MKVEIGDIFFWESGRFWSVDIVTGESDYTGRHPIKKLCGNYPFHTPSSDLHTKNWINITNKLSKLLFLGE